MNLVEGRPLVIYHGNCADGFGAAWVAWKFFGVGADYFAGVHQEAPPDIAGRTVILLDFSYKREQLREMARHARGVLVIDHHKSAEADLSHNPSTATGPAILRMDHWGNAQQPSDPWSIFRGCLAMDYVECAGMQNIYAVFDMQRSGAGMAWDFFHPGIPRPALINHIEDRDLWRFALPGTREIQANLFSYPYDFEVWDDLMQADPHLLMTDGAAIERKHHKDIAELVKVCRRRMVIAGHDIPVASLPYTLTSDAGHLMAKGEEFAACYWDTSDGRVFSLRATDEGLDVSEIAKIFGGGGHAKAAGFKVPRSHDLARA
jgi:oligoribonuclease NrnB/cAMP/cGMP phosphodiesterase (DHH superfamily)